MKKFYKTAEAGTAPGGYVVRLDGKALKTPLQHALILKSRELAEAMAAEWAAQKEDIIPAAMPLTQLACTMLDKCSGTERAAMAAEIVRYASSDLVCYFATHPADLVARQEKAWRPLLGWLKETEGVVLETVSGIQYHNQSPEAMRQIEKIVRSFSPVEFTVAQAVTGLCGSAVVALAFMRGKIGAAEAWEASCVDELYQLEKWGEDAPARKRLDNVRAELETIALFKALITSS